MLRHGLSPAVDNRAGHLRARSDPSGRGTLSMTDA
jgi:hypothetical protein